MSAQPLFKTDALAGEASQVTGEIDGLVVMVAIHHPRAGQWQVIVVERPAKSYGPVEHLDQVLRMVREMGCDRITVQLNR